jgi:hypothetical protein
MAGLLGGRANRPLSPLPQSCISGSLDDARRRERDSRSPPNPVTSPTRGGFMVPNNVPPLRLSLGSSQSTLVIETPRPPSGRPDRTFSACVSDPSETNSGAAAPGIPGGGHAGPADAFCDGQARTSRRGRGERLRAGAGAGARKSLFITLAGYKQHQRRLLQPLESGGVAIIVRTQGWLSARRGRLIRESGIGRDVDAQPNAIRAIRDRIGSRVVSER